MWVHISRNDHCRCFSAGSFAVGLVLLQFPDFSISSPRRNQPVVLKAVGTSSKVGPFARRRGYHPPCSLCQPLIWLRNLGRQIGFLRPNHRELGLRTSGKKSGYFRRVHRSKNDSAIGPVHRDRKAGGGNTSHSAAKTRKSSSSLFFNT